jgi:hypothetical protein
LPEYRLKPLEGPFPAFSLEVEGRVASEGKECLVGCFKGCYYYTDSCFRKDCKKEKQNEVQG